jgi:hypothetical protein
LISESCKIVLTAYNAVNGQKHWQSPVGTGIVAAPMTYEVDGQQRVSIAVGWGGVYGLFQRASDRLGPGAVYTFALGGEAPLPEVAEYRIGALVAGVAYDPERVDEGAGVYVSNCLFCHGVPGVDRGNIRNLDMPMPRGGQSWRLPLAGRTLITCRFRGKLTPGSEKSRHSSSTADSIRQMASEFLC